MAKYKILKTNKYSEPPFKVGDVVDGDVNSGGFLIVKRDFEGKQNVQFQFNPNSFSVADDNTQPNLKQGVAKDSLKDETNITLIVASSIGALAGLGFAYYRKSKVTGYIGYFILGSIAGSLIGNIINPKNK